MKRGTRGPVDRPSKRSKHTPSDHSVHFSVRRKLSDLHNDDQTGFIEAVVSLCLPQSSTYLLKVQETDSTQRLSSSSVTVQFIGPLVNRFSLQFGDKVQLALKGVQVTHNCKPVPFLKYARGVTLKIISRDGSPLSTNKVYDIWPGKVAMSSTGSLLKSH